MSVRADFGLKLPSILYCNSTVTVTVIRYFLPKYFSTKYFMAKYFSKRKCHLKMSEDENIYKTVFSAAFRYFLAKYFSDISQKGKCHLKMLEHENIYKTVFSAVVRLWQRAVTFDIQHLVHSLDISVRVTWNFLYHLVKGIYDSLS